MKTARLIACLLLIVTTGIVAAGIAIASSPTGGGSIAAAPTVVIGQTQFGNTTNGCYQDCYAADFWKLALIAADRVTIDWESSSSNGCYYADELALWPVGTTDYSINNASRLQNFGIGSNGKAESKFTANTTGAFPIMFDGCYGRSHGGPYDFVAYVRHLPLLSLTTSGAVSSVGTVTIGAHYADGAPISDRGLQVRVSGRWNRVWHVLGAGTPSNGQARIKIRIPRSERGRAIGLVAAARGANYVSRRTSVRTVRVR